MAVYYWYDSPISRDFPGYLILPYRDFLYQQDKEQNYLLEIDVSLRKLRNEKHADWCFQARTQD